MASGEYYTAIFIKKVRTEESCEMKFLANPRSLIDIIE